MLRVVIIAHQKGATLRQPGQGAFHHPAPRGIGPLVFGHGFFASAANMCEVAFLGDHLVAGRRVIASIQGQML